MANIEEIGKGIFAFVIGNLFFYFAWTIFSGMLTNLGNTHAYLGALGWFSFIVLYLFTVPIYAVYAIISGSRGKSTKLIEVSKAIGIWFIGMVALLILYYLFFYPNAGLIEVLGGTLISGTAKSASGTGSTTWNNQDAIDAVTGIGSLAVIITMCIFTLVPFYFILNGYGILDKKENINSEVT